MNRKTKYKHIIDLLMTAVLLLLMGYDLIGSALHEWLGTGMFLLFIAHLVSNRAWFKGIERGRYSAYRILQTIVTLLIFLSMLGLMFSGIVLSQHLFAVLPIRGLSSIARQIHMVCSFWGFLLMSLHLGFHWGMVLHLLRLPSRGRKAWLLRGAGWLAALYGLWAFFKRGLPGYLLLQNHFVFFDYEEPVVFFYLDYLAIMGLAVFCAYSIGRLMSRRKERTNL